MARSPATKTSISCWGKSAHLTFALRTRGGANSQRDNDYYRGGADEEALEDDEAMVGLEEEPEGSDEGEGDDLLENMEQYIFPGTNI